MAGRNPIFRSPEGEAQYYAAYEAVLRQWPVPYEDLCILTHFGDTHIVAGGLKNAPPLVLLPGNFASSTMWIPIIPNLNRVFRTYAVDTIGDLGKSIPTRLPASRSDYADWLCEVVNRLGLAQVCVAGLSYGGFLALNFAMAFPERVKQLVLLCPGVPSFGAPTLQWAVRGMPMMLFPSGPSVRWFYAGASAKRYGVGDPCVNERIIGMRNMRSRVPFRPVFADEEFAKFKIPTLLLIGEKEILYDAKSALGRAKHLIPHVEAECIPNAGHLLLRDQPDLVQARMLEFLTTDRGAEKMGAEYPRASTPQEWW